MLHRGDILPQIENHLKFDPTWLAKKAIPIKDYNSAQSKSKVLPSSPRSAVKQYLVRAKTIIISVTLLTCAQFNHVEFPARSQRINFSHKFLLLAQVTATPIPTSLETFKGSSSHMKFSVRSSKQPLKLNNNFNDSLGVVMTTA
jgi:hypothetical protein